ncbi:UDP-N-acetylglucosamine 2-epimerase [Riemerella columbipharyngis]|uniref:UDP-N-acetylglucosamine 2-epimerase (Hydrolysing) n=1 Tax=Riemerella columbipharyngis TaxID=1071918 RepID=A0A1G7EAX7_9FLAO|nr:UDP-N-acetylglucosamine 2-epimerase [Riemerella columbipharyngis]SDE60874.1 UDP-N-acetylglucosamine 2-epimerase (hydrolysing) [Riemerella columbipharyngis]
MNKWENKKKIVFLTGTRADFGKIKSLIEVLVESAEFEPYIFVTGMHLQEEYGYTLVEIERCGFPHIDTFDNFTHEKTMDLTLAKTIDGFSRYIKIIKPDLIVVHGDRVEALAGAITGALNNTLVAHIEGGEVSGTIDELIRHSTSKMSHIHFVSNEEAKTRLLKMGELEESIFTIGSPDLDVMFSDLPSLDLVKKYYNIDFDNYGILMFHPVTTDYANIQDHAKVIVDALLESQKKYIVIYPNNDLGSKLILNEYERLKGNANFKIYPSLRFEYFLTLLKNADFIIGNSSAGIREAPCYGVHSINIGDRQMNRSSNEAIHNVPYSKEHIHKALNDIPKKADAAIASNMEFGEGNSKNKFFEILSQTDIWELSCQKQFRDNF